MLFIRKLRLGAKIFILFFLIMGAFAGVMADTSFTKIKQGIGNEVTKNARDTAKLSLQYFDAKYPGAWSIRNGELYKGDLKINGQNQLLDEIHSFADAQFTIFQQSTRVATTIEKDGKRAVGTKISAQVEGVVLQDHNSYSGRADILGIPFRTEYLPLMGEDQQVIGIWFAGYSEGSITTQVDQITGSFWLILAVALLAAAGLVAVFSWRISKRLQRIQAAMEAAGTGDFTVTVEDRMLDEIARVAHGFNQMRRSLQELVTKASSTAIQVASTAEELTVSADETSKATEHIASSMQDIATGADHQLTVTDESIRLMDGIGQGVKLIHGSTDDVERLASHTSRLAAEGGHAVRNSSGQMQDIQTAVMSTDDSMRLLSERSGAIADMAQLIGDIASQTNLLALNAGIEAARAGESGRGFAVVAAEVKKLAEVSRDSAQRVAEMVHEIRTDVTRTVQAMDQVKALVQQGILSAEESNRKFELIWSAVEDMDRKVKESAEIAHRISRDVDEAGGTVHSLTEVARNTSFGAQTIAASSEQQLASMEEVSASSAYLAKLAEDLQTLLTQFKINDKTS